MALLRKCGGTWGWTDNLYHKHNAGYGQSVMAVEEMPGHRGSDRIKGGERGRGPHEELEEAMEGISDGPPDTKELILELVADLGHAQRKIWRLKSGWGGESETSQGLIIILSWRNKEIKELKEELAEERAVKDRAKNWSEAVVE